MFEGYGQTEATAVVTATRAGDIIPGHVGPPLPFCEVKLVDVPEMGYFSTDKPFPRGEVCSRGGHIFRGYYKDPKNTAEALDDEGWLHSGDIGQWNSNGTLTIIDRKKNIFKLAQGEYIAPEKIENVYVRSPLVAQVFVHGDSLQACLVAIVVPDLEELQKYVAAKGTVLSADSKEFYASSTVSKLILQDMQRVAHEARLSGFEQVRAIHVITEPFSVENGLLTPSFKLKRNEARQYFKTQIEQLYANM